MDKTKTAIHEAGHVVMMLELNNPIDYVEIKQNAEGKWTGRARGLLRAPDTEAVLEKSIRVSLAGKVAEKIFYGSIDFPTEPHQKWTGAGDFDEAFINAYKLGKTTEEVIAYVTSCMEEVETTLAKRRKDIERIASALETKEKLLPKDIFAVFHS